MATTFNLLFKGFLTEEETSNPLQKYFKICFFGTYSFVRTEYRAIHCTAAILSWCKSHKRGKVWQDK